MKSNCPGIIDCLTVHSFHFSICSNVMYCLTFIDKLCRALTEQFPQLPLLAGRVRHLLAFLQRYHSRRMLCLLGFAFTCSRTCIQNMTNQFSCIYDERKGNVIHSQEKKYTQLDTLSLWAQNDIRE